MVVWRCEAQSKMLRDISWYWLLARRCELRNETWVNNGNSPEKRDSWFFVRKRFYLRGYIFEKSFQYLQLVDKRRLWGMEEVPTRTFQVGYIWLLKPICLARMAVNKNDIFDIKFFHNLPTAQNHSKLFNKYRGRIGTGLPVTATPHILNHSQSFPSYFAISVSFVPACHNAL